jgi:hypothetical protein
MIAINKKTALLFDGVGKSVSFVEFDGDLNTLYMMLRCDLVDTIRLDKKHIFFVDDEGLFKNYGYGFNVEYNGRMVSFVGSGLLVGDMCGETAPLDLNFGDLKIQFVKYERAHRATEEEEI